jgi:hypothetical protein
MMEEHTCRMMIPSLRQLAGSALLRRVFFFTETGMVSVPSAPRGPVFEPDSPDKPDNQQTKRPSFFNSR